MEFESMGRVTTEATIENLEDLWAVQRGQLGPDEARRAVAADALVDTGATTLSLPTHLIHQLGLAKRTEKKISTSAGDKTAAMYEAVRLTIQGRDCTVDVMEVPDTVPVLVGQVPLELLDLVVDSVNRRLIGNPAHGGEHVIEMY